MSILLVCNGKDPVKWVNALRKELPETDLFIYPEVPDREKIDFVICWKSKKGELDAFPHIKVIQSLGAGVDHIFETQTLSKEIAVTRIVDPNLANDLWEFVVTLVMAELKQIPTYIHQQMNRSWEKQAYRRIADTRIGVLGLGQIGAYIAEKLAQMGFVVSGWSQSAKSIPKVQSYQGKEGFESCLKQADILINLLPLTPETTGILNREHLSLLPQAAVLINVGRGGHLQEEDLIPLLEEGRLSRAYLDVFQTEPLPRDHPFWQHPKIVMTPHTASMTDAQSAVNQIVENYRRMRAGKELLNQVSIKRGY